MNEAKYLNSPQKVEKPMETVLSFQFIDGKIEGLFEAANTSEGLAMIEYAKKVLKIKKKELLATLGTFSTID